MATGLPQTNAYRELFLHDVPLLDVRAPVEFAAGAFPHAVNHPLIDDRERHQIGIEYAQQGQEAATQLGHELVSGQLREQRIQAWSAFAQAHPNGVLYCFRGGQRSRISQQWLFEATGIAYPRVSGGFKALRRFLLEEMERIVPQLDLLLIAGRTGSGKTRLLRGHPGFIDLEALARHRGSAFGPRVLPQPTRIDFENALAIALIKHEAQGGRLLLEDEGRNIGGLSLPMVLIERMQHAPCVILEVDLATRIDISLQEYVVDSLSEYQALLGDETGFQSWSHYLLNSLDRIRKRLGGEMHAQLRNGMEQAIAQQQRHGDTDLHRHWIEPLLVRYYDKMYDYQIANKPNPVLFRGDQVGLMGFLRGKD